MHAIPVVLLGACVTSASVLLLVALDANGIAMKVTNKNNTQGSHPYQGVNMDGYYTTMS